jgi:integration host factor beta subunit
LTKRELVIEVAEQLGFTQNEVASIVQTTLDTITQSLAKGQRLELRNFGVFDVKTRDPRVGRNPRTGEEVQIEAKRVPGFKPGKALKEYVQTGRFTEEPGAPDERFDDTPPAEETTPPASDGGGQQTPLF